MTAVFAVTTLAVVKIRPDKNSGLCDTGAVLYQLN